MDSYDNSMNTNSVYGADDTRRAGGDFNNTGSMGMRSNDMGSTGMGQTDRFESSNNTSGGYGQQDRFDNAGSNMGGGMGGGINDDSSFGNRTDDLSRGGEFNTGRDALSSGNRDEFSSGSNHTEFEGHRKATMGDKVKGGAEKLAGKMMGNAGMQERGQERKMGEFERNDF